MCTYIFRPPLSSTAINISSVSLQQTVTKPLSKNRTLHKKRSIDSLSIASISRRIETRRTLHHRLRLISKVMCALGLFGIVLMILNCEILFSVTYNEYSTINWLIKLTISISTIILIGFICYYHRLDLNLSCISNSFEHWRFGLTIRKTFLIIIEILICSIHPIPRLLHPNWYSTSTTTTTTTSTTVGVGSTNDPVTLSYISVDVALGLPMFIRLYLLARCFMLHSSLMKNASAQSLGYLNQVSMNYFFIIKTYIEIWPARCLTIFSTMAFFIGSWSLRACNYRSVDEHTSILDSMWLFMVTFTTVGYGETIPSTHCGRAVAVMSALVGILTTALFISVFTQKLTLTRWEKYVHHFVLNIELAKVRRNESANVIKFAVQAWYLKRKNRSKSISCMKAQWNLFQSIHMLKQVKREQRQLADNSIALPDLLYLQRDANDMTEKVVKQIDTIQMTIDKLDENFFQMNAIVINLHNKLNVWLNRMQ